MTDQELRNLLAESGRRVDQQLADTAALIKQLSEKAEFETSKLREDLGFIGNSFGRFTEGLFTPSLDRILLEDFGMDAVSHRFRRQSNGSTMEVDVLGYSDGKNNTAIVVEIKSRLRDRDIKEFE